MSGVLVDSSVWIDHLRRTEPRLVGLLEGNRVLGHPGVRGEISLGSLADRQTVLGLLARLPAAEVAADDEVAAMIETRQLSSRGLGYIDAHLLAATLLTPAAVLWARDKRLIKAAEDLGVAFSP